ncbi:hypothetical protein PYCC9005_002305 [Savitreella phatthalungensis]
MTLGVYLGGGRYVEIRWVPLVCLLVSAGLALALGLFLDNTVVPINDKVQHAVMFAAMTGFGYWVFVLPAIYQSAWITLTLSVLAAVTSEYMQALLTTRRFDPYDIAANIAGVAAGLALSIGLDACVYRRSHRQSDASTAGPYTRLSEVRTSLGIEVQDDLEHGRG